MTRILVADDNEVFRLGLKTILEEREGFCVVAEAADGKHALQQAMDLKPDVVIVDYALPVCSGVDTARRIKARLPLTEVLVFTIQNTDVVVAQILESGAYAVLQKSAVREHLISAVESLADHKPFFTSDISEKLLGSFLSMRSRDPKDVLSPREKAVVKLIAEGHTNKEISDSLSVSIKTIETQRATAMKRLSISSTAGIVRYAIRNKLVEP